jgi:hypothetical protein
MASNQLQSKVTRGSAAQISANHVVKKKVLKKVSIFFLKFKVVSFKIFKLLRLRNFVAGICVEGIWKEVGKRCQVV